ncbi:MAG: thiamine pyrophosphate-binding protein [Pseudomonadota bacterium]
MSTQDQTLSSHTTAPVFTYADLIIRYLAQIDVEYIFGIPGGAIEPLYNAIGRHLRQPAEELMQPAAHRSIIPLRQRRTGHYVRPIIARHEAGAAFMADGYARETGKLGVCCATTGPGATNLITGVASAYVDRIPMLVITPQTALPSFGKQGLQESSSESVDTVGMFEHCTRYNTLVSHPQQLEGKLYTALMHAFRQPRGPVHLSIPMDILNMPVDNITHGYQVAHLFRQPQNIDQCAYQALKEAVRNAKHPVLFLGGGSRHAITPIMAFAEHLQMPFVTTPSGKSWVNSYHPLYRGVFGFAGHKSAFEAINNADVDLIIAVGTALGELSTSGWDASLLNNKLVHVSAVADDFARSPMACLHVLGELRALFAHLHRDIIEADSDKRPSDAFLEHPHPAQTTADYFPPTLTIANKDKCYSNSSPLKPQRVIRELGERFPKDTRYLIDASNAWAWCTHYLMLSSPGNQRYAFGFGAMTWAIGAAVGTALGCNDKPVVCITGDGCFLMSGQEITVAVAEGLPVIYVVLNDQAYGMVKHGQRMGGAESIGYSLPRVDFAQMALAMGAQAYTIQTAEDLARLDVDEICTAAGPTLLDVIIDCEEVPLIGARVRTLAVGTR